VFPTRQAYGLDKLLPGRLWSCGYVLSSSAAAGLPTRPRDGERPRIVVAGGGGRDAFPLLSSAVTALRSIPASERPDADIIAGPLMDDDLHQPLAADAESCGIRVHRSVADLPGLVDGADLFVTMGGYNSVVEAVASGCPTLVVPRVGPSAEQRMRASCFAERGLIETLDSQQATAARLAAAFRIVRAAAPRCAPGIDLGGADRAAQFICQAIDSTTDSTRTEVKHARAG
jgi:predicted glycosyltransferase